MPEVTRDELYRLVWSESAVELGKRFGVSDAMIGKVCRRNAIPRPGVGYWAKVQNGKNPHRERLPPAPFGLPAVISIGGDEWVGGPPPPVLQPAGESLAVSPPQESARERLFRARKLVGDVPVPYAMDELHPAVEAALPWLTWVGPNLSSEHPSEQRRIRLINAVLLAAARAGARGILKRGERRIILRVGRTYVPFTIERVEQRGRDGRPLARSEIDPLRLESCRTGAAWQDRGDNLLEYHLAEIVAELLLSADDQRFLKTSETPEH